MYEKELKPLPKSLEESCNAVIANDKFLTTFPRELNRALGQSKTLRRKASFGHSTSKRI